MQRLQHNIESGENRMQRMQNKKVTHDAAEAKNCCQPRGINFCYD